MGLNLPCWVKKKPKNLDDSKAVSSYQDIYVRTLVAAETYEGILKGRRDRARQEEELKAKKYAERQRKTTAQAQDGQVAGTSPEI